jgi:hypothetical protein
LLLLCPSLPLPSIKRQKLQTSTTTTTTTNQFNQYGRHDLPLHSSGRCLRRRICKFSLF